MKVQKTSMACNVLVKLRRGSGTVKAALGLSGSHGRGEVFVSEKNGTGERRKRLDDILKKKGGEPLGGNIQHCSGGEQESREGSFDKGEGSWGLERKKVQQKRRTGDFLCGGDWLQRYRQMR